jgi:glycosyltransferase involved in cell wall biosynthesis
VKRTDRRSPGGSGTDLVVASLEAWDEIWRRNQHLVAGLLRTRPDLCVLFVEPSADPLYALRRGALPRLGRGLRPGPVLDGVAEDRLWLFEPTKVLPRAVHSGADARLASATVRAARRLGLLAPTLWVNDPSAAALLDATRWPAMYDVTDDWTTAHRGRTENARLVANERRLLEDCAEVVVCSPALAERKRGATRVTLVTNGVDLVRYRTPAPRPADLPTGRVVLYVGTVHRDRFDVEVCAATAWRLKEHGTDPATVVLVGPSLLDDADRATLRSAGVMILGARPFETVPGYLQHADVLLVPHIVDDFTDSLDPIKLYEYRAVGRPVVATPVAGFRETNRDLVTTASAASFPDAVADVLDRTPLGAGLGPADEEIPTWATQVSLVGAVLDRVREDPPRPR